MPERISDVLCILAILTEYGRHLFDTIEDRACRSGFSTIAQFFGTARISVILAHLSRGIMRAVALERLLLERAKRGRDLVIRARRDDPACAATPDTPPTQNTAAQVPAGVQAGDTPPPQPATRPPARRPAPQEPLTLGNLPSMRDIEAEVRGRSIGQNLVAIACDFGLAPSLCDATFGNHLFSLFRWYGGSFNKYFTEMRKREKRFETQELDRNPDLGWPAQTREKIKQALGFFAGERPFDPFAIARGPALSPAPGMAVAAAATGPP